MVPGRLVGAGDIWRNLIKLYYFTSNYLTSIPSTCITWNCFTGYYSIWNYFNTNFFFKISSLKNNFYWVSFMAPPCKLELAKGAVALGHLWWQNFLKLSYSMRTLRSMVYMWSKPTPSFSHSHVGALLLKIWEFSWAPFSFLALRFYSFLWCTTRTAEYYMNRINVIS